MFSSCLPLNTLCLSLQEIDFRHHLVLCFQVTGYYCFFCFVDFQRPINLSSRGPHAIAPVKLRLQRLNRSFLNSKIAQTAPSIPNSKAKLEENNLKTHERPAFKALHSGAIPREPQQTQRLSPPLPTIVSTHSLHPVISITNNDSRDLRIESLPESTCASPPIITSLAASSVCSKPAKENEPILVSHVTVQRNVITTEELPSSSVQPVSIYGE